MMEEKIPGTAENMKHQVRPGLLFIMFAGASGDAVCMSIDKKYFLRNGRIQRWYGSSTILNKFVLVAP